MNVREEDRLFIMAQNRVCSDQEIKPRPAKRVLALWACHRCGDAGLVRVVMPDDGISIERRKPRGWLTEMEVWADIDRVIIGALPDDGAVDELRAYAALGSVAKAAEHLRRARGRRFRQGDFSRRLRLIEAAAVSALKAAGYVR